MIQLVEADDVKTRKDIKNKEETTNITTNIIPLIEPDEIIEGSPKAKTDKKAKIIIKENISTNKKYHLLRWKIKRILIKEKIIEMAFDWKTVLDEFDSIIIDILANEDIVNKSEFKERLKKQRSLLIEHHTKYKEIHGIDETKWMTTSEHRILHNRLRKERKCTIPSEELTKISHVATRRTEKNRERDREYYRTTERERRSIYNQKNVKRKIFLKTLERNIRLYEEFAYNIVTNTLTVSSGIRKDHGVKLPVVHID